MLLTENSLFSLVTSPPKVTPIIRQNHKIIKCTPVHHLQDYPAQFGTCGHPILHMDLYSGNILLKKEYIQKNTKILE